MCQHNVCHGIACPYFDTSCDEFQREALAYIWQRKEDNAQKDERIQQLERERDAPMEELRGRCPSCKNLDMSHYPCRRHTACVLAKGALWEWRGVEEDEG